MGYRPPVRALARPLQFTFALTTLAACAGARPPGASPTVATAAAVAARPPPAAAPLTWGDTRVTLTGAGEDDQGRPSQRFAVDLVEAQRVRLSMRGAGLDARLVLEGPGGFRVENDDAFPGALDAVIAVTAPASGRYVLTASTAVAHQTGAFALRAETLTESRDAPAIALDTTVTGALGGGATAELPGAWYRFTASAGSRVRLRVTSTAFDTVATVLGPRGETWVNDDGNELGPDRSERPLDSTLEVAIPETGEYHLVVTSYGMRGAGPFRVSSSARPPVVLHPGDATPREGYAGPETRGRLLGLYAGISAYADYSALYGCADDARFLAEAMRAAHLQAAGDQEVLADAAATRAAFLAGIERLARRARPDDVVLVFFSGHGNVQPAPADDRKELDGLDETAILYDGALTDTEVAEALSRIHAATVILAMDSCHAGGFADDWVTAPGRVGLFSSDADVLSDTAEPRRAGGYLSYYLRRAVLGEADARPRDGVMQAGELTDFLYAGFVTDHARMNPPGSDAPLQRLEMRRGSVAWGQTLWLYPRREDLSLAPVPTLPLNSPPHDSVGAVAP